MKYLIQLGASWCPLPQFCHCCLCDEQKLDFELPILNITFPHWTKRNICVLASMKMSFKTTTGWICTTRFKWPSTNFLNHRWLTMQMAAADAPFFLLHLKMWTVLFCSALLFSSPTESLMSTLQLFSQDLTWTVPEHYNQLPPSSSWLVFHSNPSPEQSNLQTKIPLYPE